MENATFGAEYLEAQEVPCYGGRIREALCWQADGTLDYCRNMGPG